MAQLNICILVITWMLILWLESKFFSLSKISNKNWSQLSVYFLYIQLYLYIQILFFYLFYFYLFIITFIYIYSLSIKKFSFDQQKKLRKKILFFLNKYSESKTYMQIKRWKILKLFFIFFKVNILNLMQKKIIIVPLFAKKISISNMSY